MTIKYKFNKSSEARGCVVENVGLEIEKYTPYKKLTLQTFKEALDNSKKAEDSFLDEKITGEGVYKQIESIYKPESKQFTSSQQLKDYINTIQEPIEFIAESSIDDVLMKEWIGEWEYTFDCVGCDNTNYWLECEDTLKCNWKKDYIGSPKLNSNWTFKIK